MYFLVYPIFISLNNDHVRKKHLTYYKFIRILQIPLSNNEKGVYFISWNSNFHVMKIAIFIVDARAA